MKAELIALSYSCREMLAIINMATSLNDAVGIPNNFTNMHISIYENNAGALSLVETSPPQYTP